MFIAGLFTVAKKWKQPKYPSAGIWIKNIWYICVYKYHTHTHKKNEIIPFAGMWMDLEIIILREENLRKNKYIWILKK